VLLPYIRTSGEEFQQKQIHTMLRRFLEENGVETLDLLPAIAAEDPADLVVNKQDAHPNERANELFAEAIWRRFFNTEAP
jgi:hypothetical protein